MREILSKYEFDQVFVLADEHTVGLRTMMGLDNYPVLVLPSGESTKNLKTVQQIWDFLIDNGATRNSLLVCMGGGVITDMGGFAAATFKRGIDFVNVPTTLLAMVDAGSGGKTGIDYRGLKNEIGLFREPVTTIIEPRLLTTLPAKETLSGIAEMVKHALIGSEKEWTMLLAMPLDGQFGSDMFKQRLQESIAIKERIVRQDPEEKGLRKALNFGHTIGHALEALSIEKSHAGTSNTTSTNHGMSHGFAVMYGLVAEAYISHVRMGLDAHIVTMLSHYMIENYGRIQISCKDYDRLLELMRHDKKNMEKGAINFTLLRRVGEPVINQVVSEDLILEALDYLFSC